MGDKHALWFVGRRVCEHYKNSLGSMLKGARHSKSSTALVKLSLCVLPGCLNRGGKVSLSQAELWITTALVKDQKTTQIQRKWNVL